MADNSQYVVVEDGKFLVAVVDRLRKAGFRLAQACVVTKTDGVFDVLYSFAKGDTLSNLRVRVPEGDDLESITNVYPYAYLYENEMRDLHGLRIQNIAVDFQGGLYRTAVPTPFSPPEKAGTAELAPVKPAESVETASASKSLRRDARFIPVEQRGPGRGKRTIVPFGPQHPVLPEPIHLQLALEDETVVEAIPRIGYVHRGLEKLVEKKDFHEYMFVAERICGICSFMHGMGYCMAVEQVMGLTVPPRAEFLRVVWAELSRIHSHLLWFGLIADAIGFENLFNHGWRLRENILDLFDLTTGGRVIFSVCRIGGVRKDIDEEQADRIRRVLADIEKDIGELLFVIYTDNSIHGRMAGVGTLTPEAAFALGAVGPMARGSGLETDVRTTGYSAYAQVPVTVVTEKDGDSLARTKVRLREILESIRIINRCLDLAPAGEPINQPVKGNPDGEYAVRLEQPRGEVVYYVRGDGRPNLRRMRVRTPTFANVPAMLDMLKGVDLADVPVLILTIDPCISCTER